jgi:hypothetical protein
MFEWAGDKEYGAFAVRVIRKVGELGWTTEALDALSAFRSIGVSQNVRNDAGEAIQVLRPHGASHPSLHEPVNLHSNAGLDWPGFQPTDFGQVTGTTWRRRDDPGALIPLLLRPLLDMDSGFTTYPIYQVPEIHFADRARYEQGHEHEQGWRASKLVVYAQEARYGVDAHVAVGYYLEKGAGTDRFGPVDRALWDWPRFIELLATPRRRALLEAAVHDRGLTIGDYVGGRSPHGDTNVGFTASYEEDELVLRDHDLVEIGRGWDHVHERLRDHPPSEWLEVHVWKQWPAEEAIEAGQPFAVREMWPVLRDLAKVYLDVIGYAPILGREP